ncbi:protein geranylgeranyltransferase type I subunit CDC43 [Lachancea thermotolerans CBS 6340]|uniref:KLTH0G11022p n=1 Tax=Lachancea thermotolerans (strain ATCC 56472 / CBS 6340 / NRRL Y-8284) TaxID=559295 RepID=C5DMR4_LACTC|nr:KLTH0G11022p [Lachancea thermotolerans CBS 6340]CAR25075.1 KLTH0G11022p [Lachancea thermotolerans CBS 6340]
MSAAPIPDGRLTIQKHRRFLQRHLAILPSKYQEYEANKLAIVTYALIGLSCIGDPVSEEYAASKEWLRRHYRVIGRGETSLAGFFPSLYMEVENALTLSLTSTLFGLISLLCLNDHKFFISDVDREGICRFVSKCHKPETGGFAASLDVVAEDSLEPSKTDPDDLRHTYMAIAILYLMGCRNASEFGRYVCLEPLFSHFEQKACVSGGFGQYGEPHAGYTSCALSILELISDRWDIFPNSFYDKTIEWLLQRQVSDKCPEMSGNEYFDPEDDGGFQGRENKFADSCYGFWCANSLSILKAPHKVGDAYQNGLSEYLLNKTQNLLLGGFAKNDNEDPDLYHTCLTLAALSMMSGEFDGTLFLPRKVADTARSQFIAP